MAEPDRRAIVGTKTQKLRTLPREESIRLTRDTDYPRVVGDIAVAHTIPLYWYSETDPANIIANGSAFVLDTSSHRFLVTADHVVEAFLQQKASSLSTRCALETIPFPLERRIISRSSRLDLATLEITSTEIEHLKRLQKLPIVGSEDGEWPPRPAIPGADAFFAAFTGSGRSATYNPARHATTIKWEAKVILAQVDDVRRDEMVFNFDFDVDFPLSPRLPSDTFFGGASGAPILLWVDWNGITRWRLGGVIGMEGSWTGVPLKMIHAARADLIGNDGAIVDP